ncbi:hypothetical protein Bca4012_007430 [Brassica carinata]
MDLSIPTLAGRYPDDVHDRLWHSDFWEDDMTEINTTTPVNTKNAFDLPQAIISKAGIAKGAGKSWSRGWSMQNQDYVHVYLHFAEIQVLKPKDTREFSILWNDATINYSYSPPEFMADTVPIRTSTKCDDLCYLELVRGKSSSLPPSISAMEVFGVLQLPQSETDENDATWFRLFHQESFPCKIVRNLAHVYFGGAPSETYRRKYGGRVFTGPALCVACTEIFYLRSESSMVRLGEKSEVLHFDQTLLCHWREGGQQEKSFLRFSEVERGESQALSRGLRKMDLSNNHLTGRIPEFLGKMKLLTIILDKTEAGDGNGKKKLLVPILATAASVGLITAVLLLIILFYRTKRSSKDPRSSIVSNKRSFTYEEVTVMTNNFERTLGEGGFGVVYHGNLNGNEQVAVKVLSQSSAQGYKQFKAEVDLLLRVHHINLVSLVGYCDEGQHLVLVYEYYRTNWLTEKSDVFSFGVVLLEIITSQPVIDHTREKSHIGEWVGFRLTNGDIKNIVDPSLIGDYDSSSVWKALELAISCVSPSSSGRPNMSQVANELQECLLSENSRKEGKHDVDSKSSVELSTSFGTKHTPDAR